jgi:hypothetical protein
LFDPTDLFLFDLFFLDPSLGNMSISAFSDQSGSVGDFIHEDMAGYGHGPQGISVGVAQANW